MGAVEHWEPAAVGMGKGINGMKVLAIFLAWCFLFVVCWPLALLAAVAAPLVWLVALPFRLLGIVVEAVLSLISGLLGLPGRLLGSGRQG
jgi:hypothetical protein